MLHVMLDGPARGHRIENGVPLPSTIVLVRTPDPHGWVRVHAGDNWPQGVLYEKVGAAIDADGVAVNYRRVYS